MKDKQTYDYRLIDGKGKLVNAGTDEPSFFTLAEAVRLAKENSDLTIKHIDGTVIEIE